MPFSLVASMVTETLQSGSPSKAICERFGYASCTRPIRPVLATTGISIFTPSFAPKSIRIDLHQLDGSLPMMRAKRGFHSDRGRILSCSRRFRFSFDNGTVCSSLSSSMEFWRFSSAFSSSRALREIVWLDRYFPVLWAILCVLNNGVYKLLNKRFARFAAAGDKLKHITAKSRTMLVVMTYGLLVIYPVDPGERM